MIGATLTTRLKQDGIDKSTITAFTLVFLAYNLKFLWAWIVDGVRLPLLGRWASACRGCWSPGCAGDGRGRQSGARRSGGRASAPSSQRPSWSALPAPPSTSSSTPIASKPSSRASSASDRACSQYGWRIGSAGAGALALVIAARGRAGKRPISPAPLLALPAMLTALLFGEPSATANRRASQALPARSRPSGGRSSSSSRARAPCSSCCSSCSTRSATRSPT